MWEGAVHMQSLGKALAVSAAGGISFLVLMQVLPRVTAWTYWANFAAAWVGAAIIALGAYLLVYRVYRAGDQR